MADDELVKRLLQKFDQERTLSDPQKYQRKADAILNQLLPMQRDLAEDESKRIALVTPGRNGKTFTVRGRLVRKCFLRPGANTLYIGLTRKKAEDEIWNGESGLISLAEKLGLKVGQRGDADADVVFQRQELIAYFPRLGSRIVVGGADNLQTIEQYRGGVGYDEVWIDEIKSLSPRMVNILINDILGPRVSARNGVLGMCGTPGNILSGEFYDITRTGSTESVTYGEDHTDLTWCVHRWSLEQNTIIIPGTNDTIWDRALRLKAANGWDDKNPTWMREYLGLWSADDTDFVYRFRPYNDEGKDHNVWTPLDKTPDNPFGLFSRITLPNGTVKPIKWQFAIGMDMGESDPFALECFAFSDETQGRLYHVYEFNQAGCTIDQIGDVLNDVIAKVQKYDDYPTAMVADMAGMGGVLLEEVRMRYGHVIQKAEKSNKFGAIELVNGDLIDGRMKLLKDSALAKQMQELQYDAFGKRENKSQRNDCCDATIYARTAIIKFLNHAAPPPPELQKTPDELMLEQSLKSLNAKNQPYSKSSYTPDYTYNRRRN